MFPVDSGTPTQSRQMDKYCAVSQKQPADYHLDHLNRTGVGRTQETELSDTNITFGSKHSY